MKDEFITFSTEKKEEFREFLSKYTTTLSKEFVSNDTTRLSSDISESEKIFDKYASFIYYYFKEKSEDVKRPLYHPFRNRRNESYVLSPEPGHFYFMLPGTYYFINIKKTTLTFILVALDFFFTKGLLTPTVGTVFNLGRTVARLNPENGEFCIYSEAILLKKDEKKRFKESDICSSLNDQPCKHESVNCIYNKDKNCVITLENTRNIFRNLEKKTVFSQTKTDNWKVNL